MRRVRLAEERSCASLGRDRPEDPMRLLTAATCLVLAVMALPAWAHQEKLAGGEWVLAGETGKHAAFLRFDAGRVAGSGGCNRFGGKYDLEGDRLGFSPLAATRMACPPDVMKKEQGFFDMLGKVRGLSFEGDRLELRDGAGQVLARFLRRVPD